MYYWFDTHTHIDILDNDPIEQQIIIDASKKDYILGIVNISTGISSYFSGKKISLDNPGLVFTTCGLYPSHAGDYDEHLWRSLIEQLNEGIAVGIGECGIDYYWNYADPDKQKRLFIDQIRLSKEYQLPLIIHCRDAYEDVYKILREENVSHGVMHCYSGDAEFAKRFLDLGFYISFAGNITYKKAFDIQEACKVIPMEKIVIETDSPYLSPVPKRGKKNYPAHIIHTAKFISDLKEIPLEVLSRTTWNNSIELFNLKEKISWQV